MQPKTVALVQFAKAPEIGKVKTRMQPKLSAAQSYQLHLLLTERCLTQLSSGPWDHQLWVTEQPQHDFFLDVSRRYNVVIEPQQGRDLGQRMGHCFEQLLVSYDLVILIGSDCPYLTERHIQSVVDSFSHGVEHVFIPALDGGYVLVAATCYQPQVFTDIDWGTDQVMAQTQQQLERLGAEFKLLEPLGDIDRPQDLMDWYQSPTGREALPID